MTINHNLVSPLIVKEINHIVFINDVSTECIQTSIHLLKGRGIEAIDHIFSRLGVLLFEVSVPKGIVPKITWNDLIISNLVVLRDPYLHLTPVSSERFKKTKIRA